MFSFDEITKVDPEIAAAMTDELNRQNNNLELIASEKIVSKAVMADMDSHIRVHRLTWQCSSPSLILAIHSWV